MEGVHVRGRPVLCELHCVEPHCGRRATWRVGVWGRISNGVQANHPNCLSGRELDRQGRLGYSILLGKWMRTSIFWVEGVQRVWGAPQPEKGAYYRGIWGLKQRGRRRHAVNLDPELISMCMNYVTWTALIFPLWFVWPTINPLGIVSWSKIEEILSIFYKPFFFFFIPHFPSWQRNGMGGGII